MEKFDNLVQMVFLTENPTFCDKELPINLNDIQTNKQAISDCIRYGEPAKSFENWQVYKIKNKNALYFYFIDNNVVDAYAEFLIENEQVESKRVIQRKSTANKSLLRRAFLDYFSKIFSSIQLDQIANTYGKAFFKNLMQEAQKRGFATVIVNEWTKEEAPYETELFEQYWSGKTIINNKFVRYYNLLFKIYYK